MRHLASDRSVTQVKLERRALRRVLAFAAPHCSSIAAFLAITVVDALMVAIPPLLMQRIIDDGVAGQDGPSWSGWPAWSRWSPWPARSCRWSPASSPAGSEKA